MNHDKKGSVAAEFDSVDRMVSSNEISAVIQPMDVGVDYKMHRRLRLLFYLFDLSQKHYYKIVVHGHHVSDSSRGSQPAYPINGSQDLIMHQRT